MINSLRCSCATGHAGRTGPEVLALGQLSAAIVEPTGDSEPRDAGDGRYRSPRVFGAGVDVAQWKSADAVTSGAETLRCCSAARTGVAGVSRTCHTIRSGPTHG